MGVAKLNAGDLVDRLRAKYETNASAGIQGSKGYEVFTEISRKNRRIDALAVGVWGSTGHGKAIGFEIKTSRSDALNELEHPEKAMPWREVCNAFWFVATPGCFLPGEIPDGIGLMETRGKGLVRKVSARTTGTLLPPEVLMSLIKRMRLDERSVAWDQREYAEWKGRTVSIADLKRIAGKLPSVPLSHWEIRQQVEGEISKKNHKWEASRKRWKPVLQLIAQAAPREARSRGGIYGAWDSDESAADALAWIEGVGGRDGLEARARVFIEIAEEMRSKLDQGRSSRTPDVTAPGAVSNGTSSRPLLKGDA